ncbi:hypothetical protein BDW22DRAFT_1369432 [Trametopsis cervina]|nr:hypothetical protein BDW22DRAFT_1369432 [Trametopsis cervina]
MTVISHLFKALFASTAAQYAGQYDNIASFGGLVHCDISKSIDKVNLAPINNAFHANFTPTFVGLAFGTQNYTCTQTNNFTNVGAVAELFDVSCLVNSDIFTEIQVPLFNAWNTFPSMTIQDFIGFFHAHNPPEVLAQHFFIPNPVTGTGLSPTWDFRSSGNPKFVGVEDALFVGQGVGNIPAPNKTTDVAWLDVANIGKGKGGRIADEVFRTDTIGGQPPTSCTFGQTPDIQVKYVSKYWFFGGGLGGPAGNVTVYVPPTYPPTWSSAGHP